jgi:hypothetical protein
MRLIQSRMVVRGAIKKTLYIVIFPNVLIKVGQWFAPLPDRDAFDEVLKLLINDLTIENTLVWLTDLFRREHYDSCGMMHVKVWGDSVCSRSVFPHRARPATWRGRSTWTKGSLRNSVEWFFHHGYKITIGHGKELGSHIPIYIPSKKCKGHGEYSIKIISTPFIVTVGEIKLKRDCWKLWLTVGICEVAVAIKSETAPAPVACGMPHFPTLLWILAAARSAF